MVFHDIPQSFPGHSPKWPFFIIRFGLGITFLWIGILILMHPEQWVGYVQPWALNLFPLPPEQMLTATGFLDAIIGVSLMIGLFTRLVAVIAAIHLILILITSGITDITVRDIGLLASAIALTYEPRKGGEYSVRDFN